jgi:hypothetical protein
VTGEFTADFNDLTHWNRTANDTHADLVLEATYPTAIETTYYPTFRVTVPDAAFQSPRPQVTGPDLLQQTVTVTSDSSVGDPPVIEYISSDVTL